MIETMTHLVTHTQVYSVASVSVILFHLPWKPLK